MKKILNILWLVFVSLFTTAQTPDAKQLHETAKTFIRQRDYPNATLVLNRALLLDPKNIAISKDLAWSYYLQKENARALEVVKPILEQDDADDECFQLAGKIYHASGMDKECEKAYKKGIKKFPNSGGLYNDWGELLMSQRNIDAIKQWEKGIEQDPGFSRNYYNAAKYYFLTTDKVWAIIYAEVFINLDPTNSKTPEVKELLLEGYKKLFANADLEQNSKDKNIFTKAYLQSMNKQSSQASLGLNAETLTMIRTRFILDWNSGNGSKFPYRLFDYQRELLQEGLFDAYNQWIFGPSQNLAAFQNWINTHNTEYTAFNSFQKGKGFKMPEGQYYH